MVAILHQATLSDATHLDYGQIDRIFLERKLQSTYMAFSSGVSSRQSTYTSNTSYFFHSLGLFRKELAPLLFVPRARDLAHDYPIPAHRGRNMNSILSRKPDYMRRAIAQSDDTMMRRGEIATKHTSVFEIFRYGDSAVRAALELEEFLEILDLIRDDLSREAGKFLPDLDGSQGGRRDVEEVALVFEELET